LRRARWQFSVPGGPVRGNLVEPGRAGVYRSAMTKRSPFRYFKTSPEIIRLTVMMYIRFSLSLRNVEDLLHERGIDISHETVRFWWNRFGPMFAAENRSKYVQKYGIVINQCVTPQRTFDPSPVPSATTFGFFLQMLIYPKFAVITKGLVFQSAVETAA
jgi:hypothetical protein